MKSKNTVEDGPTFIQYDDNNIDHVMAGPDYGQIDTGSKSTSWSELESKEYEDFVDYITEKIIARKVKFQFPL